MPAGRGVVAGIGHPCRGQQPWLQWPASRTGPSAIAHARPTVLAHWEPRPWRVPVAGNWALRGREPSRESPL